MRSKARSSNTADIALIAQNADDAANLNINITHNNNNNNTGKLVLRNTCSNAATGMDHAILRPHSSVNKNATTENSPANATTNPTNGVDHAIMEACSSTTATATAKTATASLAANMTAGAHSPNAASANTDAHSPNTTDQSWEDRSSTITKARNSNAAATATKTALFHQQGYIRDRLDAHIEKAAAAFTKSSSWGDFIRSIRGKGDLHPNIDSLNHPDTGCSFCCSLNQRKNRNDFETWPSQILSQWY